MQRIVLHNAAAAWLLAWGVGAGASDAPTHPPTVVLPGTSELHRMTAEQIVERNVVARGGLEAWRKIQTMGWIGRLESPGAQVPMLPFVFEQKRPNKTHFEVNQMGEKSLRIFDGMRGWRVRPEGNGKTDVQTFTKDEIKFAKDAQGIEGPLIDYKAKGSTVELVGVDAIEGRRNFRISVRLASGERSDIWIDTQTFLETKYDRVTYSQKGVPGTVSVMYRDYKTIEGVTLPTEFDIGVGSPRAPDKMFVDKIAINPPLDDKEFTRPGIRPKHFAIVDVEAPPGTPASAVPPQPRAAAAPGMDSGQK